MTERQTDLDEFKFKIGDEVKIISGTYNFKQGKIVKVLKGDWFLVQRRKSEYSTNIRGEQMEKI